MPSADSSRGISISQISYHPLAHSGVVALPWYRVGVVLIALASLIPRLWKLGDTALWTDEVLTTLRVQIPLSRSLEAILAVGNQMPLYYFSLRLLPASSPAWLRMPSVFLGLLSILLLIHLVHVLYDDRRMALLVGALVAANPLHVMLSRTARYYTLLMAVALIVLWCFLLILRGRRSRALWAIFGVSSGLAYLIHYTALALPAAQFWTLALARRKDRRLWGQWIAVQGLAVLPLLGWLLLTLRSFDSGEYPYLAQPLALRDVPLSYLNLSVGYDGTGSWLVLPGLLAALLGLILGGVYAVQALGQEDEPLFWLLLAALPVLGLFALSSVLGVQYRDRYFLVAMPAVVILVVRGWQHLPVALRRACCATLLLTSTALTGQLFHSGTYQRSDWKGVTRYVGEQYRPGDVVLFERGMLYEAFRIYFDGDPAVLDHTVVLLDAPDPAEIERRAARIWVVYQIRHEDLHRQGWVKNSDPFALHLSPISDWLAARRSRILHTETFDGVLVFLLPGGAALNR